jgi:hypothetical protein
MVSFVIFKKQPKLQEVFKSLEEGNFKPKFQEVDDIELVTLTLKGDVLDVIISFDSQNHKATCLVIAVPSQGQFAHYESFFHQAVTGKDLLNWWFTTCLDLNMRIEAARAIELAFV